MEWDLQHKAWNTLCVTAEHGGSFDSKTLHLATNPDLETMAEEGKTARPAIELSTTDAHASKVQVTGADDFLFA